MSNTNSNNELNMGDILNKSLNDPSLTSEHRSDTAFQSQELYSLDTLTISGSNPQLNQQPPHHPVQQHADESKRKIYRPSSVFGVQYFKAQCYPVLFLFTDSGKSLIISVYGDRTVSEVKEELWMQAKDLKVDKEDYLLEYEHPEGYLVELYDENQLMHTISNLGYWIACWMTIKLLVVPKEKTISKHTQYMNKKIGNLIGYGLYRFDYLKDPEIDIFRRKMVTVRKEALKGRDLFMYTYAPDIYSSPASKYLLEKLGPLGRIQIRLHLGSSNMVNTITCLYDDTPEKVIASILTKKKINISLEIQSGDPKDYCLKVCGRADYLTGEHKMIDYAYIRKSILKEERINLSLLYIRDLEIKEISAIEEFNPIEDSCINLGAHSQLTIEGRNPDDVKSISLWDIARNYRVQITACENLNIGNLEMLYVEAGIYHGGVLLCPLLKTHQVNASRSPRWGAWLNFDIPCYNLPRTARLCITVWGRWNGRKKMSLDKEGDLYPLGWVNMLIMDYKGYLKTGLTKMGLWVGEKANPIGTCTYLQDAEEATIFVRFDKFVHPVIFPTEKYHDSLQARHPVELDQQEQQRLETLINTDPLARLDEQSKEFLWKARVNCVGYPQALPKILLSTRWNNMDDVMEIKRLLTLWEPMSPEAALELLDANFADMDVRAWAVERLESLSDSQVLDFLLQLVQALKYEPYLDSALGRFLLKRALRNKLVGHHFFWYLRSEMEDPSVSIRFALMLEAYVRGCGPFMDDLGNQTEIICRLLDVSYAIKRARNNLERKEILMKEFRRITLPRAFQLPLDPRIEARGLIIDKCKFMDSKKLPLWCVFENSDSTAGQDIYIIFKSGDDLRQDMLTLQMIRIMEKLWRNESLDFRMLPYGCISTGSGVGLIEVVLNAETVSNIQLAYGGSSAAFKDQPIDQWLRKQNPDNRDYEKSVETFTLSCAGYCVATYVLGIGDRHNDNIMVTKGGHLFHIDFGHFLGNIKKKFGFKRERAPFVLTPDFVYVISKGQGTESQEFGKFIDHCVNAFLIIRRNSNMFINLFAMMLSTGIPELKSAEDIYYLRDALCIGKNEDQAAEEFRALIFESLRLGWSTQLNWWIHNLAHSSKS